MVWKAMAAGSVYFAVVSAYAHAEPDWPSYGVMSLEEYQAYFHPGAFLVYLPDNGWTSRDTLQDAHWNGNGEEVSVVQTWASLSVSTNLLPDHEKPFIKFEYPTGVYGKAVWRPDRKSFSYEVAKEEFEADAGHGLVYLSDNDSLEITPGDEAFGTADDYFDAAYEATGGECCLSDEDFAAVSIGRFLTTCSFVAHKTWDVLCVDRHIESGFSIQSFYARMGDEIG